MPLNQFPDRRIGAGDCMFAQAVLAGLALSKNAPTLSAHMFNGAATVLASTLQTAFAVLPLRSRDVPRWQLVATVAVLAGQLAQNASGRIPVFALHLPLGVGVFGVLIVLLFCAWSSRPERAAPRLERRPSRRRLCLI
jgi:hypothetical protein